MNKAKNTKVIIAGAGYAGMTAALHLSKRKRFMKQSDVLILDSSDYHLVRTELHRVAAGDISEDKVCIPIKKLVGNCGINFVQTMITGIDPSARIVETTSGNFSYDILLISTGSQPQFFGISGVKKNAYTLKDIVSAVKIKEKLESIMESAEKKTPLPVVVAGAGTTGIEMSAYIRDHAKEHNSNIPVILVEKSRTILPDSNYSRRVIKKVHKHLNKNGVEIATGSGIKKAGKSTVVLENGTEIKTSMLIWTAGITAGEASAYIGRGGAGGRHEVRPGLNLERYPEIFIAGDSALVISGKKTLPCSAQYAIQQGETAAANIVNFSREKPLERYVADQRGEFISIGGGLAVGWIGIVEIFGYDAQFVKDSILIRYLLRLGPDAVRNFTGI